MLPQPGQNRQTAARPAWHTSPGRDPARTSLWRLPGQPDLGVTRLHADTAAVPLVGDIEAYEGVRGAAALPAVILITPPAPPAAPARPAVRWRLASAAPMPRLNDGGHPAEQGLLVDLTDGERVLVVGRGQLPAGRVMPGRCWTRRWPGRWMLGVRDQIVTEAEGNPAGVAGAAARDDVR